MTYTPRMLRVWSSGLGRASLEEVRALPGDTLFDASIAGELEALRRALAAGDSPNVTDPNRGFSPLMCAAAFGHTEVVRVLLEHGASHAPLTYSFQNPLVAALARGHDDCAELVWAAGCRVERLFYDLVARAAPLSSLAWVCAHQQVDLGLELFSAARCRRVDVARWLLDRGADIHTRKFAETCLMVAAEGRQLELMQLFLDHGADPAATSGRGDTALEYAIYCTDVHDPEVPRDAGVPDDPAVRLLQRALGSR